MEKEKKTDAPEGRTCTKCGQFYTFEHFHKCEKGKNGYKSVCKACASKLYKEYRPNYKENKEKKKIRNKKYREKNKEYFEKYRKEHREYFAERRKEFLKNNPDYYREKLRDPLTKRKSQVRIIVRNSFMKCGHGKDTKVARLTGLPSAELTEYLLETFRKNYGREWDGAESVHIDHIIPLETANCVEAVDRLCNYKNLQLLTAEDNLRKKNNPNYNKSAGE